jgi:O-antigen ligase
LFISFYFFLAFSIFFPIRHVFYSNSAYFTGEYSDFTSFSLYLSDILIITLALVQIYRLKKEFFASFTTQKSVIFLIIWLILGIFLHFRLNTSLSWYIWLKYAELIVTYGTFSSLAAEQIIKPLKLLWIFVIFSSFECLLAIWQFIYQKSTDLWVLNKIGESLLRPNIAGVAKIISRGTVFIRGYGTFPHPNLLGAFLVISILCILYLIFNFDKKQRFILFILLFINILGITVTFSRASYLALAIGLALFLGYLFYHRNTGQPKLIWTVLTFSFMYILVSFLIFKPFILTRATVFDQATVERATYNRIGIQMIKNNPFLGIGIGESVLHMEQYDKTITEPWQKQPIHNYFILAAAEIGIPGALALLWIFSSLIWKLLRNIINDINTYHLLLACMLISILVLMQFDHYFYTLEQTQLLLWALLGLTAPTIKKSPKGDLTSAV